MWKTPLLNSSLLMGLMLILLGFSPDASAACTSPAGNAGQLQWISPNVRYCDGTSWLPLNDTSLGTACTKAGEINYASGELRYCNGSVWIRAGHPTLHGSCTTRSPGYFYYDQTGFWADGKAYYWFCNGTNWRRMGP